MFSRFQSDLEVLKGLQCSEVIAGHGTGSAILLDLGPRHAKVSTPAEDEFDYDWSIRVNCAWRLDSTDRVLCGWSEFDSATGEPPPELIAMKGHVILRTSLTKPSADLTIFFATGEALRIFCDNTLPVEGDNYAFRTRHGIWIVGARGILAFEEAK